MTIIKKIYCKGFKSFAKPTEILFGDNFNVILGPNGSGKSTRYDTEILLSTGEIKQIGQLVEESLEKSSSILKLDDGCYTRENPNKIKTWGLEPKSMKVVEKDISAFIKRDGEPFLYEIKTRSGKKVTTTGCHPVMIFKEGEIKPEVVSKLSKNNVIATPRKLEFYEREIKIKLPESSGRIKRKKEGKSFVYYDARNIANPVRINENIDENFASLLGYIVGDGNISKAKSGCSFTNKDKELIEDFKEIASKIGVKAKEYHYSRYHGKAKVVYLHSTILNYILKEIFNQEYKGEGKHIPSCILFSKKKILSSFLAALFDCDAYVSTKNTFEYTTKSETLAKQVQLALLRFGIISLLKEKEKYATHTKSRKKRKYYSLFIQNRDDLERLFKNINLKCKYKRERLEKLTKKKSNPNIDLLPQEVNSLVKECTKLLYVEPKPIRKWFPKFAAYQENRCAPSKNGIKDAIIIFRHKIKLFKKTLDNLKINQELLVKSLKKLDIPSTEASKFIGINKQAILRDWLSNKFQARPANLKKLYQFFDEIIRTKLKKAEEIYNILERLLNSDIFWDEIVSIKKVNGEPFVYDLTIPNCHNFIGNGIFVHNSNIVDALCFVLGKSSAKGLRAEKSANLIYNGGKKKAPAKEAEVSLVFGNEKKEFPIESSEIKISRIVKQSGQSTYKINDEVRTRQQMLELLSKARIDPDGHNIILQGDIIHFTEMKNEDRREVIEEVAGISVYEDKKQKAIAELGRVDTKLSEVNIILTERETYLKELKKDRDQALKYKELEENIKSNKATYLHLQIKDKETKKEEIETNINKQKKEIERIEKNVSEIKEKITQIKEDVKNINVDIEEKGEKEQLKLNKEIEELKTEIIKQEARRDTCKTEIEKIKTRHKQLRKEKDDLDEQINNLKKEKESLEKKKQRIEFENKELNKRLQSFREKHNLGYAENLDLKLDDLDKDIEKKQYEILAIQEKQQNWVNLKTKLEVQIQQLDEKLQHIIKTRDEDKDKREKLNNLRKGFKEATVKLAQIQSEEQSISAQLTNARIKHTENHEKLTRIKARQISAKEHIAGNIALRRVLEIKEGVYGTVADLGNVSSKYSLALEIAAGSRIKSVVVEDDTVASKCIKMLKERKLGVVTFLPLNKIKQSSSPQNVKYYLNKPGVIGMAIDLVSFDQKFKDIFSYVFGSTLIVEDVESARKIGIGNARMVTLEGDLMEQSGAMIGGHRVRRSGSFKVKEIDADHDKTEEEVKRLAEVLTQLEKRKVEITENIFKLKEKKALFEVDITNLEKTLQPDQNFEDIEKEKNKLTEEHKEAEDKIKEEKDRINKLQEAIKKLKETKDNIKLKIRNPKIIAELNNLDEERQKLRISIVETDSSINNLDNQLNNIHLQEKNKIESILKGHEKELQEFEEELAELLENIKSNKDSLKEKESKEKKFYNQFKQMLNKRNNFNEIISKKETNVLRENEKIRAVENRINSLSIDRAKVVAELEGLNREFEEVGDGKIRRGLGLEELKYETRKFEGMIKNMGNVNLRALEVYEKVHKEYERILSKVETLKLEKEEVLSMIAEIDSKKQDIFMKCYKIINENFKRIFSSLSTKGDAHLDLEEPEDVFKGGVDVKVRIIGNKFLDIKSLSGGEKTLTALAFIFAIQEYAPASFYFLDEVDAALDKRNSELLLKLIEKYAHTAQYIVISHNDAIISEADRLYGLSMQEGVSKIVSLKI